MMKVARTSRSLFPKTPVLARDYIGEVLYAPKHGYFNNTTKRILAPKDPFDFVSFEDEQQYRTAVSDLYKSGTGTWTTPVELFHPHYSAAIGKWGVTAAKQSKEDVGLHFVEVGGGTGTCAIGILNFLQENHPEIYGKSSYTIVELSEELSKLQKAKFKSSGHGEAIPCNVVQESGLTMDPSNWSFFDKEHKNICVVALEVLDNMPHDKSN
jgi:SAM-dependent MidA family methyltransferase